MNDLKTAFMYRIRDLRIKKNLTLDELGSIFQVGKSAVHNWEVGRNFPSNELLIKLSDYFGVTTDYLLGRPEVPNEIMTNSFQTGPIALEGNINDLTEEQKKSLQALADHYARENKKVK